MRIVCFFPAQAGVLKALGLFVFIAGQMMWWVAPAEAQTFLQDLFGLAPQQRSQPAPRMMPPRLSAGGASAWISVQPGPDRAWEGSRAASPEGSGSYTTVCVRMCDGFFFPISQRAPRSRFHHDADACRSRCGRSEARLFYHSSTGGSMQNAVDLDGRSYARTSNAFLHRRKLVSGCACKPEPWSDASLMRHQQYAVAEGIAVSGGGIGSAIVVAGRYLDGDASQGRANGGSESNLPDGKASDAPIEFEQQPLEETRADPAPALISAVDRHRPQGTSNVRLHAPRPGPTARTQSLPSKLVTAPPRKPVRVASAQGMGSGLFGSSGGNKLRWPGDAR